MRWKKQDKPESSTRRVLRSSSIRDKSYSYYKSQKHTPNTKPIEIDEPQHSRLRLLPSIVAILVIVGSIFYAITLSTSPNVKMVQDQISIYRPIEDYERYASEVMSADLTSYTKFTANTTKLKYAIAEHFPEVDGVAVRLPVLGRKPTITLSIRQPSLLLSSSTNLFVLDQSGLAVALARDVDAEQLKGLYNIKDESGLDIEVGDQIVTSETIDFINNLRLQFGDKKLEISELLLPLSANQLDVKLAGTDYYIKMDISGDVRLQAGRYIAVKTELAKQGITPKEYIDVRVEEKVFYK